MILPMLAGIFFFVRSNSAAEPSGQWRYSIFGAIALGAAISIKLVPLLLLPVCAFALGRRAIALVISLIIPALLSLPFGFPRVPIWESLGRFIYVARLNDIFWWIVEDTFWPNPHQRNYHYNVIIVVAVLVVSIFFIRNWKRGLLWVMGTALILSPVLHPWYCTWILPVGGVAASPTHGRSFRLRFLPTIFSGTNGSLPCPGTRNPGCADSSSFRRWPLECFRSCACRPERSRGIP
jgi:hypothetical protein